VHLAFPCLAKNPSHDVPTNDGKLKKRTRSETIDMDISSLDKSILTKLT
jgi:hypothetical protein